MPKVSGYGLRKWMLGTLLLTIAAVASGQYQLKILPVDKDSVFIKTLGLQQDFPSRLTCMQYIDNLIPGLQAKGYPSASADSVWFDSTSATIKLFFGETYKLAHINTGTINKKELEQAGWNEKSLLNKPLDIARLQQLKENLLAYYEENGYPFAKIQLDSLHFENEQISAKLKVDKGPQYKIDSLRIYGNARINNIFLQRYLDIKEGSYYQKSKMQNINKRLLELPYIEQKQPWDMTMLGTGSVLNLYLLPKKSSQINVLVGFLPANQVSNNSYEQVRTKLLFTGEATINLKNALGNGELIGLDWQQLQQKSPKLNLQYQQPYLFGSPFGISTSFDLFKKDSSYLNLNLLAGVQYALSVNQTGRIFVQVLGTNLLNVDTLALKATRKLPNAIDVSSFNVGVDYNINKTNYRLNPRRGYELQVVATTGTKNIKKNNVIVKLADPDFLYASLYDTIKLKTYQFSIKTSAAKYFSLGRQSTIKMAINGGWLQSPNIFRNELFQIGGYKLMRGFDEESIFASQYAVTTAEYRYLVGLNSYFFVFADGGWAQNKSVSVQTSNTFIGVGLGMAFETKAGIFNISYANGKRNDVKFDLRQSKIHIGYVNYF
ncbi:MAG TPA: BamA/TamA family outer membrane protein [Chitinophagaceae bacterium]|nr:BamA/TamA family outer membrane protein [Chitinophagaceae bacterium]